jgi:phosphatidate phosphatase APP1
MALLAKATVPALAGSPIKSDEELVFFTTAAHREGTEWVAPVHGWIFEPEEDSLWRAGLLAGLEADLDLDRDAPERARFRHIARWFLVDNERGKKITVDAAGSSATLGRSAKNGHFRGQLRLPGSLAGRSVRLRARTRKGDRRDFQGQVLLVAEEGLSVVSDIDDTLKITGVGNRKTTLRHTFLEPFEPVPGMGSLLRTWKRQGAVFHYLSGAPWHLYVPLRDFLKRRAFPAGTMELRDFRIKDDSRWNLLESPGDFKLERIEALLARFPKRRFVLLGDSGQDDPEVYGTVARRHPDQIQGIYIRVLDPKEMRKARQGRAFGGVDAPVHLFRKASELAI